MVNDTSDQNIMWEDIMQQRDLKRHLSINQENWQFICDIIKRSKISAIFMWVMTTLQF